MSFVATLRQRNSDRYIALLATVAMLMSLMVIFAQPALAHHPVIAGDLTCNVETDQWEIVWSVDNSESAAANRTMTIDTVEYNGPTLLTIVSGATDAASGAPKIVEAAQVVTQGQSYTLKITADWNNGGPQDQVRQATIAVPDETCFNPSCPDNYLEYKVEPVTGGTHGPGGEFTVTLGTESDGTPDGPIFDWTSTVPVYQVIVKGGPGANVYNYSPDTSGSGLHAPVNPNNDDYYGLSHITFCYGEPEPEPGTVTVIKKVVAGDQTAIFEFGGDLSDEITHLESISMTAELGETYTSKEFVPDGWKLTNISCETVGGEFEIGSDSVGMTVNEEAGSVTCTFENAELPTITVVKETVALDPEDDTTFAFAGDLGGNLGDGDSVTKTVIPGEYETTETVVEGWTLTGIVCDREAYGDLEKATASYDVDYGDHVSCTFTNVEDEVAASVLVTVGPLCDEDSSQGKIDVTMSVEGAATVVIKDGDGVVVDTVTTSGMIPVPAGASYSWSATPNEGFEFPPEFVASGEVDVPECDEVLASVLVTVGGECVLDGDKGHGEIDVVVSVANGATVVIKSGATTLHTLTSDGTVTVTEGQTYSWEATPNEGFEFPPGFVSTGLLEIETCTEVLPFTGIDGEMLIGLSILLLGAGSLLVFTTRKREEG